VEHVLNDFLTGRGRRLPPLRLRLDGGLVGGVDVVIRPGGDVRYRLPGGRILYRDGLAIGRGPPLAPDIQFVPVGVDTVG
jgi:hypothetical protein